MSVTGLAVVIGQILAFVGLGVAVRALGLLKAEDARPLNTLLVYVGLPALIFTRVHAAPLGPELLLIPVVGWVVTLVALGAAYLAVRLLKLPGPTAGAFVLCAVFGNTGYIGYPVASALLGEPGLVGAILFDLSVTVTSVLTIGVIVAGRLGRAETPLNPLRELVLFPPMIALVVALALKPIAIPLVVSDWLEMLASIVVPLIMVAVGLSLQPKRIAEHLPLGGAVGAIKLIAMPLLALGVGALLLPDADMVRVVVLEAGVPSMMLGLVIGMRYRLDVDFIASAILLTTVASVVTVPLFQLLVG